MQIADCGDRHPHRADCDAFSQDQNDPDVFFGKTGRQSRRAMSNPEKLEYDEEGHEGVEDNVRQKQRRGPMYPLITVARRRGPVCKSIVVVDDVAASDYCQRGEEKGEDQDAAIVGPTKTE